MSYHDLVIDAKGVRKAYDSGSVTTAVLKGVDLEAKRGECIFLAGPSGSGKSTLLSILGCVLSADDGSISILGENVRSLSPREQARFRRTRIGFVFQRFHLFRGLTAWENVRVPLDLLGRSAATAKSECDRLLAAAGIADKAGSQGTHLSMGQRQGGALARALARDPGLIFADE